MKPIDIAPADLETVRCILREHTPGLEVRAFGSRVSWTARETSDLDIALLTDEPLSTARMTNLKAAFTKSYLPFRVDIVDWASTSEIFRRVIESEHVVLVEHKVEPDYEEWQTLLLGKCANLSKDNVSPSELKDAIYIGLEHIGENTLSLVGYGSANDVKSTKTRFQNGDILFGKLRPYFRKVVLVNFDGICSTDIWVIRASEGIHQRFLFYNIASQSLVDFATLTSEGTRMPRAKWNYLAEYELQIPKYSHQCAIASILGTLDDKIELNHRMNKTLEDIAQALFKSWFVDFEPVKAKLAVLEKGGTADEVERAAMRAISGRDEVALAKLKDEQPEAFASLALTAAQFPPAMQEGELGEVPEGWKIKLLRDCFDLTMGQSPPSIFYNDSGDGLPFFQGRSDFRSRFPTNRKYCSKPIRTAQGGDTLISVRAPVGDINMAWQTSCIGRGIAAIRHKSKSCSFTYYSAWAIQKQIMEYEDTGTVFGSINKNQFESIRIIEPNSELIKTFDKQVRNLDLLIRANTSKIRILSELRDTMLPNLLSGEIRVLNFKSNFSDFRSSINA